LRPGAVGAALQEFFLWTVCLNDQTDEFCRFLVPWFVYEFGDDPPRS
jgi:hypothetical protein